MKKTLLINACARPDSRTYILAEKTAARINADYSTINLYNENLRPLDYSDLIKRDSFIEQDDFGDDMFRFARDFRDAEEIVIAAPYWDLSFPSVLKCYFEAICVSGLTFKYGESGQVIPLCKCKRLIYVTTAGGYIGDNNFGYDYVKALCVHLFGIDNIVCVSAEGLDIIGNDIEAILKNAENAISTRIVSVERFNPKTDHYSN